MDHTITATFEPGITHTFLTLGFALPVLEIEGYVPGAPVWQFGFALAATPQPGQEDFYLYLHFADTKTPKQVTVTAPYRLHVTTLSCPGGECIYHDDQIQQALMAAVVAEIDMQLRQVFYRQADPRIDYARLTNIVGGEFARTRRAHFLPR